MTNTPLKSEVLRLLPRVRPWLRLGPLRLLARLPDLR